MDVVSIQVPSGSYTRGTILNISVRAQASAGTTISLVNVPSPCGSSTSVLNLSSGTNTDGTYSGVIDTGGCKRTGGMIYWPAGNPHIAMYVYGGNGATSFVAGQFTFSD